MVQKGMFWCWEWGRLWVRALEPCGKAALCYFCPWSRRVLQSWALCTHLPPSSFLGACAAPYVNPGERKLGVPHPGGSHHQPVVWAPSAKIKPNREGWEAAATQGANWQVSVSSRSFLSSLKPDFLPPKSCFKIFQMTAYSEIWWRKLYELGARFNGYGSKQHPTKEKRNKRKYFDQTWSKYTNPYTTTTPPLSKWSIIFLVSAAMY